MRIFFSTLLLFFLVACQPKGERSEVTLRVAVAANMQFAMEALELAFEANSGIPVDIVIGSSGKLAAQIRQGAPYDLFFSANMKYPNYLEKEGLAAATPSIYAYGELVLWTTANLPLDTSRALLHSTKVEKIGMANPMNAPYGEAAKQYLQQQGQWDALQDKIVFAENIAQVNQYILSGACLLGFTAKSLVLSPKMKDRGQWVSLSANAYAPIAQGVVQTKYGATQHPEASQAFLRFLKEAEAQEILQRFGYRLN